MRSLIGILALVICANKIANAADKRGDIGVEQKEAYGKMSVLLASRSVSPDLFADADIFLKGVTWALRFESELTASDTTALKKSIARGKQRINALLVNQPTWTTKRGAVLRGYVSAIDGSTQPYGVIAPQGYDGSKPMRLDVVLHGSSNPNGLSEVHFGARFDDGDSAGKLAPENDFIELHPLGRVENCYRWAGETDVFEAIEAVARNYNIDRDRIVLRGMSMGASGTWHLGLKHPDRFVAIGPYAGYVDTHRFSITPGLGFVVVGPLPSHQERALHMLDSVDYAANASLVPAIAAIGANDVFFDAHVIMGDAMAKEGVQLINLISPGTTHVIDPVTHAEQMKFIGMYAKNGLDHDAEKVRFVTWTLKYNRCQWLEILALNRHYERAEVRAIVAKDGVVVIDDPKNVTEFAIHLPNHNVRIAGNDVPSSEGNESARVFALREGSWKCLGTRESVILAGKRPGLQGPIDDAFTTPFICVRGTGKPWNQKVAAWADASLRRFEYEWAHYMRGDLPVKNDTEVTDKDVRSKNLILFGDPGNNSWIAKALPKLPVLWTSDELTFGGERYSSRDHAPVMICASPIDAEHYIVLNSGHTFHEKEFSAFNYLLFPRLGDWAIMRVSADAELWHVSDSSFPEEAIRAGFFDEQWLNVER